MRRWAGTATFAKQGGSNGKETFASRFLALVGDGRRGRGARRVCSTLTDPGAASGRANYCTHHSADCSATHCDTQTRTDGDPCAPDSHTHACAG